MQKMAIPLLLGAMFVTGPVHSETYKGYEMPPFEVLDRFGDIEIRNYAPHKVAEVIVQGGQRTGASRGFRALFRYIAGGNATGEKITMTVPVAQVPVAQDRWAVRFMMPAAKAAQGLPNPENGNVRLVDLPGGREAVLTFVGRSTPASVNKARQTLLSALAERDIQTAGAPHIYYYDDPMTMPWKRRTEVAVPLR